MMTDLEYIGVKLGSGVVKQPCFFRRFRVADKKETRGTKANERDRAGQIRVGERRCPGGIRGEKFHSDTIYVELIGWMHASPFHIRLGCGPKRTFINLAALDECSIPESFRMQCPENAGSSTDVIGMRMRQDERFECPTSAHDVRDDGGATCITGFPYAPGVEENPATLVSSKQDRVALSDIENVKFDPARIRGMYYRGPGDCTERNSGNDERRAGIPRETGD